MAVVVVVAAWSLPEVVVMGELDFATAGEASEIKGVCAERPLRAVRDDVGEVGLYEDEVDEVER